MEMRETNKKILASTQFSLNRDFARGIMNCVPPVHIFVPVHILHLTMISLHQASPSFF